MTTSDSIGRSNSLSPSAKQPLELEPKRKSLVSMDNRDSEIGVTQDSRVARHSPPPPNDGARGGSRRVRQGSLTNSTKSIPLQQRDVQVADRQHDPDTKWGRFKKAIVDFFKWIFGGCLNIRERKVSVAPSPAEEIEATTEIPLDLEVVIAMKREKLNQMTITRIRDYGDLLEQLNSEAQKKYRTQLTIMMEGYNTHANKEEWTDNQVKSMLNAFKAMDALFKVYLADDIRNFAAGKYETNVRQAKRQAKTNKVIAKKSLKRIAASRTVKLTPRVQILQNLIVKRVEMYASQVEESNNFKKSLYNTRIMTVNYCLDAHKDGTELSPIENRIAKSSLETIDRMFGNGEQSDLAMLGYQNPQEDN